MINNFQNNFQRLAKKYLFELLKENYQKNEEMINRLTFTLATEKDVQDLCQIVADAWSCGFKEAVDQYKNKLQGLGYAVVINQNDG